MKHEFKSNKISKTELLAQENKMQGDKPADPSPKLKSLLDNTANRLQLDEEDINWINDAPLGKEL